MLKYASFLWDKISKFSSAAGDIKVSCHNPDMCFPCVHILLYSCILLASPKRFFLP